MVSWMLIVSSLLMRVQGAPVASANSRVRGRQRERMQLAAHVALQRGIDDLVLLHPRLALERRGHDGRGVVIAVAGEIADLDLRVGQGSPDQPLDSRASIAMRRISSAARWPRDRRPCSRAASPHAPRAAPRLDMGLSPGSVNASPPVTPRRSAGTPARGPRAIDARRLGVRGGQHVARLVLAEQAGVAGDAARAARRSTRRRRRPSPSRPARRRGRRPRRRARA